MAGKFESAQVSLLYIYIHVHFHGHDPLQMTVTITERILDHLCCPDSSVGTGGKKTTTTTKNCFCIFYNGLVLNL